MSVFKNQHTSTNEISRRASYDLRGDQKINSSAMAYIKKKYRQREKLRRIYDDAEEMVKKAKKNPRYRELIERAKKSKTPGSIRLATLISIYGSIEDIPKNKQNMELIKKVKNYKPTIEEEKKND